MKKVICAALAGWMTLMAGSAALAQDRPTGLKFADPATLKSIPLADSPFSGDELPAKVDLSPRMPAPGDQGTQNSCVAWAVAYGLKSYQEHTEESWSLADSRHLYSPSFVYNQINNGQDGGSLISDAMNVLAEHGAASLASMPYRVTDYRSRPPPSALEEARRYRISYWRRINPQAPKEVKAQLNAGFPVVIGASIDAAFEQLQGPGATWSSGGGGGGHAMLIVGYDDTRGAFRVLNSWGPQWGDRGYAWITYAQFTRAVREAYVAKDAINGPGPSPGPSPGPTVDTQPVRPTPRPTQPDSRVAMQVQNVMHNQPVPTLSGVFPGMTVTGAVAVPPGVGQSMQVVVKLFHSDPAGNKGQPVQAIPMNLSFRDHAGQVAFGTVMVPTPTVPMQTPWQAGISYIALGLPNYGGRGTSWFVAEPVLYVDNFGVAHGEPVKFFVNH